MICLCAVVAAAAVPAAAQVQKQVEVTRDYVPSVAPASKLAIAPDMTDTVRMRPEIDYTITPMSWQSNLSTEKFRPATLTYWDLNRPRPFYLKLGAGYPLRSEGDFYASTQNPDIGFLSVYANHRGGYARPENYLGVKADSRNMNNRVGITLGAYTGKRKVEGDFSYDMDDYRRHGGYEGQTGLGDKIATGLADAVIRFGDDFADLSRVNFELAVRGSFFHDGSVVRDEAMEVSNDLFRQYGYGASGALARRFGSHMLRFEAEFDSRHGLKACDYSDNTVRAGLRYGRDGGAVEYTLGADYIYDRLAGKGHHYVTPYVRLRFDIGRNGHFVPFIEADGNLRNNSFMSLTRRNPYVIPGTWADNTLEYSFRVGVAGNAAKDRIAYRLTFNAAFAGDEVFWYVRDYMWFGVETARCNTMSFDALFEYRPVSSFLLSLGATGRLFSDNTSLAVARPSFEARAGIEYSYRKWSFGASAHMATKTRWTSLISGDAGEEPRSEIFVDNLSVDVNASVEWNCSSDVSIYLEGRNLANAKSYPIAYCPNYGIGFLAGVKVQF